MRILQDENRASGVTECCGNVVKDALQFVNARLDKHDERFDNFENRLDVVEANRKRGLPGSACGSVGPTGEGLLDVARHHSG